MPGRGSRRRATRSYLAGVPSFTERYHELTKYRPETIDRLGPVRWSEQPEPFKDAPAGRRIDLIPELQAIFTDDVGGPDPLHPWLRDAAVPALARLLHCTLGLTARLSGADGGHDLFLRAAPSAGGLYPTEVYVVLRGYPDVPDGVYHYHSLRSGLIPVWEGNFFADLRHHFLGHPAVDAARVVVIFTGMYGRSAWRYKERAYRRILLDTGHAAANLLEMAEEMGIDAVPLGGFLDAGLEELLFLGPKEEFPLLGVALGPGGTLPPAEPAVPGPPPGEAVRRADASDPMMVQQNACERIGPEDARRSAPEPPVPLRFDPGEFDAQSVILRRRSTRRFNGGSVSLRDAEEMLRFAFRPLGAHRESPLLAPGALTHHVVALAVDGILPGVYALDPHDLTLSPRRGGDFRHDLQSVGLGQDLAHDCAFALVTTADMAALVEAYGDRGYRYACMDCGQVGQRIQLWAVHRDLGSSGIGGYFDDLANEMLGLPLGHGVLYLTVVGVPEE